jgi:hypothetical protein
LLEGVSFILDARGFELHNKVASLKIQSINLKASVTPKIPQNPKWVAGTLGRLSELDFLIFFDALFMVDSINHKLFVVVYFIAF